MVFILLAIWSGIVPPPQTEASDIVISRNNNSSLVGDNDHESGRDILSLLVYLDNVDDTLENRELLSWTLPLIHSNILVEFVTPSGVEIKEASSVLVATIVRSSCVLRSAPPLGAPLEEVAQFMSYVHKFDMTLAPVCHRGDSDGQRECWEQVGRVFSHHSPVSPLDSGGDVDITTSITGRSILYLPSSAGGSGSLACSGGDRWGLSAAIHTMGVDVVMVSMLCCVVLYNDAGCSCRICVSPSISLLSMYVMMCSI
jgi:hypothetical protein